MKRETRIPGLRRVLRLRSRGALETEISDEIRFHLDARVAELTGAGIPERDARARAEGEFGDLRGSVRELLAIDRRRHGYEQREELLMSFLDDLRYAARGLARRPALLVVTTLVLCIGIAANAVMFGVVDQLLLKAPLHVVAPDQVQRIYFQETRNGTIVSQPVTNYPLVTMLQRQTTAFSGIAAFFRTSLSLGRGADARGVDVQLVSGNYFDVLGVRAAVGRTFASGEDTIPVGAPVTVVSHQFWQRELGASPDVMGRRLHLEGKELTIIGVAPKGFSGLDRLNTDMWTPVSSIAAEVSTEDWHSNARNYWVQTFARIRTGESPHVATAQATSVFRAQLRELKQPWRDSAGSVVFGSIVGTRTPNGFSAEAKVSLWVMGVSMIVLLIACANVANLLIARTVERRREIAVRIALGVSRARLIRMLLVESALLAGVAAIAALLVSYWASRVVQNVLLPGILWSETPVDGRVLAFTLIVTVLCVLLAGLAPSLQSLGLRVTENLKAAATQVAGNRGRLRQGLLVAQAALSIVLLIGAGLFVRSLRNVTETNVGIDLDRVIRVNMNLSRAGFSRTQIEDIYARAHERVRAMPGVEGAALAAGSIPMQMGVSMGFSIPGVTQLPDLENGGPYGSFVSPDYFPTLGTRIVRGRNFTDAESRVPTRVMIINEMLAKAYFPGKNPVGQCVLSSGAKECTTIVGVVEDVMLFQMVRDPRALVFVPRAHPSYTPGPSSALLVRTSGDPYELMPLVRREIQQLAPNMPHVNVQAFSDLVAPQLRPWRLGATMFTLFGIVALVIASVGLYSVMAYWVTQRTHEIGVRMALGAQRAQVMRLVAWQTARGMLLGVILGSVVALAASRWIVDMLYETSPRDPLIYALAAAVLLAAAILAGIVPVRRSTTVDPVVALRTE